MGKEQFKMETEQLKNYSVKYRKSIWIQGDK